MKLKTRRICGEALSLILFTFGIFIIVDYYNSWFQLIYNGVTLNYLEKVGFVSITLSIILLDIFSFVASFIFYKVAITKDVN